MVEALRFDDDDFREFFKVAVRQDPYPYQIRMAEAEHPTDLIEVPTGMGKTECAILSWLWRRKFADDEVRRSTPRRLIYCLPMRTLVEQTQQRVTLWLDRLGFREDQNGEGPSVRTVKLMGGEVWGDWDTRIEQDQIIIGTQDMLLSRALNRGYGMSKFRWPLLFGILNNDCIWVIDEPQLMGAGLTTTAQMQWFRETFGSFGPVHTIWMSATMLPDWIKTTDFPSERRLLQLTLEEDDLRSASASKRLNATKRLIRTNAQMGDVKGLASEIWDGYDGTTTLVVMNTVRRAKELYKSLSSKKKAPVLLLHSQFRPDDRRALMDMLNAAVGNNDATGPVIVSTQVIEAGVDVSVRRLYTELAPWASLVQRFGRCNRRGEHGSGEIFIILPSKEKLERLSDPYSKEEMVHAYHILDSIGGEFSSLTLPKDFDSPNDMDMLRTTDLLELFDTTSDIFGNSTDVSRFIRSDKETNVHVFWRDLKGHPLEKQRSPLGHEMCPVPIAEVRDLLRRNRVAMYRYDHLDGEWRQIRFDEVRPGDELLMDSAAGHYSPSLGWDASISSKVTPITDAGKAEPEGYEEDRPGMEKTIEEHSKEVLSMAERMLAAMPYLEPINGIIATAALWHDAGKAHPMFQTILGNSNGERLLAKSFNVLKGRQYFEKVANGEVRRYFRHELVSALMSLKMGNDFLPTYLAAAHHGKVRVSIRSMPGERGPSDGSRFARGVWEGDVVSVPPFLSPSVSRIALDLSVMDMGMTGGIKSWTDNVLELRDAKEMGPFRLAFLEGLLRSADERASGGE